MTKKKPNYSQQNTSALQAFCDKNGLVLTWKNQSAGHAVVSSPDVELYVWVQRMKVEVRKRNGVQLAKSEWVQDNYIFQEGWFKKLLGERKGKKKKNVRRSLDPHHENGVTVVRIPQDATEQEKAVALRDLHNMAQLYNRPNAHRYGSEW